MGGVARQESSDLEGPLVEDRQEGRGDGHRQLRGSSGGGPLLRLDRRPEGGSRRGILAAEIHPARPAEPVVEGQSREGDGAHRERPHAAGGAPRQRAGRGEVERAKADGRWEAAYDAQSKASVPEDLQRELDANPDAAAFFATLESYNRYAILYRLQEAKKPETRAKRIEKFIGMLKRGEKVHP